MVILTSQCSLLFPFKGQVCLLVFLFVWLLSHWGYMFSHWWTSTVLQPSDPTGTPFNCIWIKASLLEEEKEEEGVICSLVWACTGSFACVCFSGCCTLYQRWKQQEISASGGKVPTGGFPIVDRVVESKLLWLGRSSVWYLCLLWSLSS